MPAAVFKLYLLPTLAHGQVRICGQKVFVHCKQCARDLIEQVNLQTDPSQPCASIRWAERAS